MKSLLFVALLCLSWQAVQAMEKCKNFGQGMNYCREWCNVQWGCGKLTDGILGAKYECDCTGCNGCGVSAVAQCKDFGGKKNYCSEWCNTRGKWGCGTATVGNYTCNCAGCNGCSGP